VSGSAPELSRVVRNLLDNAIRHTPPGGTVEVAVRYGDGWGEVSVRDGCGGIPDDELDRVFDLAYRGDTARTPAATGAGLGLAIARGLVDAHHGDIAVRNEQGGCRFTVRLPLA
jgi:signal transduction histidine kinase